MLEAVVLAAQSPVSAPDKEPAARQEIVVTGERIARSSHETASSVVLHDAASIDAQATPDRIEQILQMIPNVQLGSGGEGPVIRGQDSTGAVRDLPAFLGGVRPRATISVDGRSANYFELAFGLTSLWDIERVEVFRSPQTTTQGRNSIGGAIFVETRDPGFDWEGRLRLLAGQSATRQEAGVVSGPLIDGQLAFRVSGDLRRSRTSSDITSRAIGIDPNRDDSELVRVKLLARPTGLPDTRFELSYTHGRSQMPQIEGIEPPYAERRDTRATYGIFVITVDSLTGRLSYDPPGDFEARGTVSYGRADVRRHAPPGLGVMVTDARDFSVEPVLAWRSSSGSGLTLGLHYTRATLDQAIDLTTLAQVAGFGAFDDTQHSLGLFGEGSIVLAPNLTLTGGLRHQYDRQIRKGGLVGTALTLPLDYAKSFSAWLPKVSLAWDISPQWRIGALVQRASNPGGVNLNPASRRIETFDAERLWDIEMFARARLADGKLTLSANAFRYEMRNAQRSQSITIVLPDGRPFTSTYVSNAPRATTKGIETEIDWRPSARLALRGAIGLLDTQITSSPDPDLVGKQFQRSPHFTGAATIVWTPTKALMLSGHLRHNSSYFSDDKEASALAVAGSTTVDARVAWSHRGTTLFAYARNLFDEFHLTYRLPRGLATAGDPREIGIGLEARF